MIDRYMIIGDEQEPKNCYLMPMLWHCLKGLENLSEQ